MAIRTALLNWNNISRDTDFSKYIETVSEPWVIEGLEVSATKVGIWKARVPCERTNWETIYALVYNSSEATISWNGEVYILVSQTYIDDWELANEDWTWIATIEVWTTPSKNALKLATITSWTVVDNRNMIPKVWELSTQIDTIFSQLEDLDERVEKLEEAWAIDHLEESGLVGELYSLSDTLFKQNTPALADSSLDCNVSDVAANTQIHIQRIGSGVASNQLKLKVKMVWSSTQNLKVEVRKWVKVEVSSSEAYWYWDEVIASWSIAYSDISSDYAEKTITLDNNFWWTKGELLDIVVYMDTVNASNYYCVACDSTQYSEWFSYVSVNGSTRTRSKLMPYGISEGFAQSLLVKVENNTETVYSTTSDSTTNKKVLYSGTTATACYFTYGWKLTGASNYSCIIRVSENGTYNSEYTLSTNGYQTSMSKTTSLISPWTTIQFELVSQLDWRSVSISDFQIEKHPIKTLYIPVDFVPKSVKALWETVFWQIFWMNEDWIFKWWLMLSKETTATTGSITLWDAQWYIKVNLNWEIVKIPYYWD